MVRDRDNEGGMDGWRWEDVHMYMNEIINYCI